LYLAKRRRSLVICSARAGRPKEVRGIDLLLFLLFQTTGSTIGFTFGFLPTLPIASQSSPPPKAVSSSSGVLIVT
jgi:hypothetical protein